MPTFNRRVSVAKTLVILATLRSSYPRRISAKEFADALDTPLRSVQRDLHDYAAFGVVESDNQCPAGWKLTEQGKQLLGLNQ